MNTSTFVNWGTAAKTVFEAALFQVAIALLIAQIEDHHPLLQQHGYQLQITRCKIRVITLVGNLGLERISLNDPSLNK